MFLVSYFFILGILLRRCSAILLLVLYGPFVKWWLRVTEKAQAAIKSMDAFYEEHRPEKKVDSAIPLDQQKSEKSGRNLRDEWESHIRFKDELQKPMVAENKERIAVWIMYWPFSFLWSIINDIVKRLVEQFVIRFQKFYQRISDRAYRALEPQSVVKKGSD